MYRFNGANSQAIAVLSMSAILSSASMAHEFNLPQYTVHSVEAYIEQRVEGGTMFLNESSIANLDKIERIARYKDNWDGFGARSIDSAVIENAKRIIGGGLIIQPELFPNSATNTIQLEYEGQNGRYLELQVTKGKNAEVFEIGENDTEREYVIPQTVAEINKAVGAFYGRNFQN